MDGLKFGTEGTACWREREREREICTHYFQQVDMCDVQSSKSAFQMSCDSLQLVLTASHWCSTTAGINEHWIHESTTTVTPKGVGMLCTTYMKQNLVNTVFKTFVNICSFWIWWQRHVSKELGQGQQKTRKVVERPKTASFLLLREWNRNRIRTSVLVATQKNTVSLIKRESETGDQLMWILAVVSVLISAEM